MNRTVFLLSRAVAVAAVMAAGSTVACGGGGNGGNGGGGGGSTGGTTSSNIPTLASVAVSPATATGGDAVQGTVTLTSAPTVGAAVTLASNNAAASVPASVTVNSGAMSNTFNITTSAVAANTSVVITGSLNGTQSATLTLMPPPTIPFAAKMVVRSLSAAKRKASNGSQTTEIPGLGPGTLDTCPLENVNGSPQLSCEFDGSSSTSPSKILEYRWAWQFGSTTPATQNNVETKFQPKVDTCGFFGGRSTGATQALQMTVTLIVVNSSGSSPAAVNQNVLVYPAGLCGYNF